LTGLIYLIEPAVADGERTPRSHLRLKDFCGLDIARKYSFNIESDKNIEALTHITCNFTRLAHFTPKIHPNILRRSRKKDKSVALVHERPVGQPDDELRECEHEKNNPHHDQQKDFLLLTKKYEIYPPAVIRTPVGLLAVVAEVRFGR
jgi:hypothetical protein